MERFKASIYGPTAVTCAVCGFMSTRFADVEAHHVVYRQHCPPGTGWDPRNALAVCVGCHEAHHNGSRRIPLGRLTDQNLEFAQEVLGPAWEGYLSRRYSGSMSSAVESTEGSMSAAHENGPAAS